MNILYKLFKKDRPEPPLTIDEFCILRDALRSFEPCHFDLLYYYDKEEIIDKLKDLAFTYENKN